MNKKILLIDANLLLFRSFYAAQAISKNIGNLPTHLFFTSFLEIYKDENPDYVFFAFDSQGKTKRHQEFPKYKAGRTKAPNELYQQKKIIRLLLDSMNLINIDKEGDEADDLIATLCEKFKNQNEIIILSEDKDLLQLVDENISIIIKNRNKKIKAKYKKINMFNFFETFNFLPFQTTDYKGIAGDNSDNLSGVKGIGPKTTIELLSKYQNLENIYEHLDELSLKQRKIFIENKEHSFMCKRLATLNRNVDINIKLEELNVSVTKFKNQDVINKLDEYNLKKIKEIINSF